SEWPAAELRGDLSCAAEQIRVRPYLLRCFDRDPTRMTRRDRHEARGDRLLDGLRRELPMADGLQCGRQQWLRSIRRQHEARQAARRVAGRGLENRLQMTEQAGNRHVVEQLRS